MIKITGSILGCFLLFAAFAAEPKAVPTPTLSVSAEVSKYVPATECYVVFLLETSGENMLAAKTRMDEKLKDFSEKARKEFSPVNVEAISINIGTRDFSSFRVAENPFSPTLAKVLICTLPPEELTAVKFLDFGVKSGLTPFCGTSGDGSFGAVFYSLNDKNLGKEFDGLYALAAQKLQTEVQRLADMLGRKVIKMEAVTRFVHRPEEYELRFKDMKVILPSEFCSSDRNKIKVSLVLHANFVTESKKSGE